MRSIRQIKKSFDVTSFSENILLFENKATPIITVLVDFVFAYGNSTSFIMSNENLTDKMSLDVINRINRLAKIEK